MNFYAISNYNSGYDRQAAAFYAEKYAEFPNLNEYPYYNGDDCTNFVSQALSAGGMYAEKGKWDSYECWFCNTKESRELKKVSITWRAARYFRKYWGSENGSGRKRAYKYGKIPPKDAILNFNELYEILNIGDVVQYSDQAHNNYPYHTQIICRKAGSDFLMAQHTANAKNVSLYEYLNMIQDQPESFIHIYIIA